MKPLIPSVITALFFTPFAYSAPNPLACEIEIYVSNMDNPSIAHIEPELRAATQEILLEKGYHIVSGENRAATGLQLDISSSIFQGYSTYESSEHITITNVKRPTFYYTTSAYLRNISALTGGLGTIQAHIIETFQQGNMTALAEVLLEFAGTKKIKIRASDFARDVSTAQQCNGLWCTNKINTYYALKDIGDEGHYRESIPKFVKSIKKHLPDCDKMSELLAQ